PHRQRPRAAARRGGGDRSQFGPRPGPTRRPGDGAERRRPRDGGPAVDSVLLLAPLPLPDGRSPTPRARLSAAQTGDRELPRVRRARRRWALASAADALTRAGHGVGRELRSRAAQVGTRDIDPIGGPAVDSVLLLAPLPLPDGRSPTPRARLSAAQTGDRELPRVRRARRRWALASAADALTRAGHGVGRELRSRAAQVGTRDID